MSAVTGATTSAEPRRLRADAARNRQALIDAAERLFARRGLAATLDDIAAEAGVNVATAYRHFANKQQLASAFLEQSVDRAIAIATDASACSDPWDGLVLLLERELELMGDNRCLIDVFSRAYGTDWFDRLHERVNPLVADLIRRGQGCGVVRSDVTAEDFGVILPMLGTVTGPDPATALSLRRRYLSLVLAGLRPSPIALDGAPPSEADIRPAR